MRAVARLLGKLALVGGERSFTRCNQAFWNCPGSQILVAPERSPRMTRAGFRCLRPFGDIAVVQRFARWMQSISILHARPHGLPFVAGVEDGEAISEAAWH